jgi:hypothetical protein
MNKRILAAMGVFAVSFMFVGDAQAVMQSLNGASGQSQTFSNDTNVTVTTNTSTNTHAMGWSGVLQPSRGGLGVDLSAFNAGSVLFYNGTSVAESGNLFWDETNSRLGIGSASPGFALDVQGSAAFNDHVYASNGVDLVLERGISGQPGNIRFMGDVEQSNVGQISVEFSDGEPLGLYLSSSDTAMVLQSGTLNVGIGTINPQTKLDVIGTSRFEGDLSVVEGQNIILKAPVGVEGRPGNIDFYDENNVQLGELSYEPSEQASGMSLAPAGSWGIFVASGNRFGVGTPVPEVGMQVSYEGGSGTLLLGSTDTGYHGHAKGCLILGDSDGDGVTYVTADDGVLSASTTKPSFCE